MRDTGRIFWAGFVLFAALFFGACGGDDEHDERCPGGECGAGACTGDEHCSDGYYCGTDNQCVEDPCADFVCERGVCAPGTLSCESKSSCSESTEVSDCVYGEYCVDGECVDEAAFCDELSCKSGVCDPEERACVNAVDCDGQDQLCAPGYFCNSLDQCVEDLCEKSSVQCPDNARCQPAVGACETPVDCEESADCAADHVCIAEEGAGLGVCTLESIACGGAGGDGGCMGSQQCVYDPRARAAECVEADICETGLDCVGDRQCAGKSCMPALTCVDDPLEPNDTLAQASDFHQFATLDALDASICADDVDIYRLDTAQLGAGAERGLLKITLEYTPRDLGQGGLVLELFKGDSQLEGEPLASAYSGVAGHRGRAEISYAINSAGVDEYLLRVADAGDVLSAGVAYRLAATLQPFEAAEHCQAAREILAQSPIVGEISEVQHTWLSSTCAAEGAAAVGELYYFEVLSPSYISLSAEPTSGSAELSVSIRRDCERLDTELGCERGLEGAGAELDALLAPGRYYALVEARAGEVGEEYSLRLDSNPAACTPAESYCETPREAAVCADGGFGFERESCVVGCDPRTGECLQTQGDHCANPFVLDPAEVQAGISARVAWGDYRDEHRVEPGGCVPELGGDATTHGPDAVWQVEIPAGFALNAQLSMDEDELGALYIFEDCEDITGSCLAGANVSGQDESSLHWANEGEEARVVFLVADRAEPGAHNEAGLEISVDEIACSPGETTCAGDELFGCNAERTDFEPVRDCPLGCEDSACLAPANDTCGGAEVLNPGEPKAGEIDLYNARYEFPSEALSCAGSKAQGLDAVYAVEVDAPGQLVEVELEADFEALLYVTRSCVDEPPRCFVASEAPASGQQSLAFIAASAGLYYIYVDSEAADISGAFSVQAHLSDASELSHCAEAAVLSDGDSVEGELEGDNLIELRGGQLGRCQLGDAGPSAGAEDIYRVDLEAGELLSVEISSESAALRPFIAESCESPAETCQAIDANGQEGLLEYYAQEARSVFIIVDATQSAAGRDDSYRLDVHIAAGLSCAPGRSSCVDAATLATCRHDGGGYIDEFECPAGCADGACLIDPAADRCAEAPVLGASQAGSNGAGVTIAGELSELNNDVALTSAAQCAEVSGSGPDLVYALEFRPGDTLSARFSVAGDAQPLLYLVEDCADPDQMCLDVSRGRPGVLASQQATLNYRAESAQTLYLVADTTDASAQGPFLLEIELHEEECAPNQRSCADQDTEEYCENGRLKYRPCYYGGCASGECIEPEHDRCVDALSVPAGAGEHSFYGFVQDFSDTVDLADALLSCDGVERETPGPDAFYAVELAAGQVLDAQLHSAGEGLVWLSSDCHNAPNTCAAAAEAGGARSLRYRASSSGTYYLVVDHFEPAPVEGEFQLDIQVRDAECSPGEARCLDADTLQVCSPNLGLWADVSCQFGCDPDHQACLNSEGGL